MGNELTRHFQAGPLSISVYETKEALGREAASAAAALLRQAIRKKGKARVLFSAANSQLDMVANLTKESGIDWSRVYALALEKGKTPVEERSSSECAAVEAQIVGHVLDPVLGFVGSGKHVPLGMEALFDKCFMYCFYIRQPDVISPYIQPNI